ncbi:MAG: Ppx/GppA family phosphatase [Gammaproteobacteria bacterium]|nr:Ppx/GppA family phosphatase [Gammaproteobacteria bacterium]
MIVGELRHGQLAIIDRLRETVRISEGLKINGNLDPVAKLRGLDCLSRFGERLQNMHASSVRAAGTSALRRARDSQQFLVEAEEALGHPIEVISGIEEARLIYSGVSHSLPPNDGMRLVLDIGGGSTELILGLGVLPKALESLHLGCVGITERFFPDGALTREAFEAARVAARLELRPVKAYFRDNPDIEAIGTSGTINSTARVAGMLGLTDANQLDAEVLEKLIERVLGFGEIAFLSLPGLSERRAQVWPGGLSILVELLAVLRIERLQVSDGALREGLLYDQLGRLQHEDARERTVRAMQMRYNVDQLQADRVAELALTMLAQCRQQWQLDTPLAGSMLEWSALLHEIGLDIAHDGYQRHGAYIAANADMPGFPSAEQKLLAFLIARQRRSLETRSDNQLPAEWQDFALRLAILLRVAVLLNRSRSARESPMPLISVSDDSLHLQFPAEWLESNPLTVTDLNREREYLRGAGYDLTFE